VLDLDTPRVRPRSVFRQALWRVALPKIERPDGAFAESVEFSALRGSLVLLLAALLLAALAGLLRLLTGLLAAALLLSRSLLSRGLLVLLAGLLIALVLLGILVRSRHFKHLIDVEKNIEHSKISYERRDYKLLIVPLNCSS
jgi:hypothetical protein